MDVKPWCEVYCEKLGVLVNAELITSSISKRKNKGDSKSKGNNNT